MKADIDISKKGLYLCQVFMREMMVLHIHNPDFSYAQHKFPVRIDKTFRTFVHKPEAQQII